MCRRPSLISWLVWIVAWCTSEVVLGLPAPGSHGAENGGNNNNNNRPANLQVAHSSNLNHPPYNPPQQFHSGGNQQNNANSPNSINMEAASSNSYGSYSGGGGGYEGGSNYGGENNYGFDCYGKKPGMYGDASYDCRIYHVCQADGRADTLYCPKWTRFNNYNGVCDWHFKVDNYCNPLKEDYGSGYSSGGSNYGGGSTYSAGGGGGGGY